ETALDFLVVAVVCIVAVSLDLLAAAGAGVALSIVLFLRDQMRTPIVRRKRSGAEAFSSTKRLPHELALLEQHGKETLVLELQDDLFFGTADQLYHELDRAVREQPRVILSLRNVQSLDFSAAHTMRQVATRLSERGGILILSDVPDRPRTSQDIGRYLTEHGLVDGNATRIFGTLDEALEWVEDRILAEHGVVRPQAAPLALAGIDCLHAATAKAHDELARLVVEREFKKGETIFRRGDTGDSLLFVRQGAIRVQIALQGGRALRLATFGPGDVCGEMAFIDGGVRSADAVALEPTAVFELSRDALTRAAARTPEVGEIVFLGLARTLTSRLRVADRELHALQDA
ncbi:MAG: cyclic nucleotide-binding domain-containing protein, partial [Deltaproteobacteria bacterium]|nr:cyclic nucleotide-binding domain-containing protein [Deltaproteobacteria bacterium]